MKTGFTLDDGVLPIDFDLDGYFDFADRYNVTWDNTAKRLVLDPAIAIPSFTYQMAPPILGTDADGAAPFPSARVIALGALIYAKKGENPTRADVQQEWDMFHSELDRLVGRADSNRPTRPRHYLDVRGTHVGDVGA